MDFKIYVLKLEDTGTPVFVVQMIEIPQESGEPTVLTHNELFNDEIINVALSYGIVLKVHTDPNRNPVVITENVNNPAKGQLLINVTQLFPVLQKMDENNLLQIGNPTMMNMVQKFEAMGIPLTQDTSIKLYKGYQGFKSYLSNEKSLNLSKVSQMYLAGTRDKSLIDRYTMTRTMQELWYLDPSINKTKKQITPDSELYAYIPDFDTLVASESTEGFANALTSVVNPYEMQFAKYGNLANSLLTLNYRDFVLKADKTYDLKNVTGDASNNDLPIQENEKQFYDALCALCDYAEKRKSEFRQYEEVSSNGLKMGYFTDLQYDFRDFIYNLIRKALKINYSHTEFVPVSMNDEESNEEENIESATSTYSYQGNKYNKGNVDGADLVMNYVETCQGGPHALCEALIKLLRWGDRKPTKLKVTSTTGINKYLDLETFRISNSSGSFANMEIKLLDGAALRPAPYVVSLNDNFVDTEYIRSIGFVPKRFTIPVGIQTYKSYLVENSNTLNQIIFLPIIDLVYNLLQGINTPNDMLYGFKYDSAKNRIVINDDVKHLYENYKSISCADSKVVVESAKDSGAEFYQSGVLKDIFLARKCWNPVKCSVLSQINNYMHDPDLSILTEFYAENETDLITFAQECNSVATVLHVTMFNQVLRVLCKVNDRVDKDLNFGVDTTFEDILSYYAEAMIEIGFNYGAFTEGAGVTNSKLGDLLEGGNNTKLQELNVFDQDDEDLDDGEEFDMSALIYDVPVGANVARLFMKVNQGGEAKSQTLTYAHYVIENGSIKNIVIMGSVDASKYNVHSKANPVPGYKNINIDKLPDLFSTMVQAMTDSNVNSPKYRFTSKEAIKDFVMRYHAYLPYKI